MDVTTAKTEPLLPSQFRSSIALLYAARGLRGFGDGFAVIVLPAYLTAIGYDPVQIGIVATVALLGTALLTLGTGIVAARHDLRTLLIAGAAFYFGKAPRAAKHAAVIAENKETLQKLGWKSVAMDMGFARGDSTVTITRHTGGNLIVSLSGDVRGQMLPYLADSMLRQINWQLMFTVGQGMGTLRPLILMSPILAETIAAGGWSKETLKRRLFEQARIPAAQFERILRDWTQKPIWNLTEEFNAGRIPKVFHESDDPERMVPLVWKPEDYMIVVTGDLGRNSCFVFAHNGVLGYPVGKEIKMGKRG